MMDNKQGKKVDVACGRELDPAKASYASEYDGEAYHFCSASCKQHFDSDPEHYAGFASHEA